MKVSRCGRLSRHPLTGHWYRALNLKHWKSRLATRHTTVASHSGTSSMGRQSGLTKLSDPKTRQASLGPSVIATATISRPDDRAHGSPGHRAAAQLLCQPAQRFGILPQDLAGFGLGLLY
jgi:hypothetical protein